MAFQSIEEIDSWAEQKGGVDAVREVAPEI
jgi:hypothetical protein